MRNLVFRHIEFLLPKHNCVIIPDFGGFIVNMIPAVLDAEQHLVPPTYSIVFNQALKHNDGLLATSISDDENTSYDAAYRKIKDVVKEIKQTLTQYNCVDCGNLGRLTLDQYENIAFECNTAIKHPAYYGLAPMCLQPLLATEAVEYEERKHPVRKYVIGSVAAAAVAVLLYAAPINFDYFMNTPQQADFTQTLSSVVARLPIDSTNAAASIINSNDTQTNESTVTDTVAVDNQQAETEAKPEATVAMPTRTYYIIVAGNEAKSIAQKQLDKARMSGFDKAEIVQSGGRYRISIASFDQKREAERYLDILRIENPKYQTAWLYSKKNTNI